MDPFSPALSCISEDDGADRSRLRSSAMRLDRMYVVAFVWSARRPIQLA
jgi:hypothetical protein